MSIAVTLLDLIVHLLNDGNMNLYQPNVFPILWIYTVALLPLQLQGYLTVHMWKDMHVSTVSCLHVSGTIHGKILTFQFDHPHVNFISKKKKKPYTQKKKSKKKFIM